MDKKGKFHVYIIIKKIPFHYFFFFVFYVLCSLFLMLLIALVYLPSFCFPFYFCIINYITNEYPSFINIYNESEDFVIEAALLMVLPIGSFFKKWWFLKKITMQWKNTMKNQKSRTIEYPPAFWWRVLFNSMLLWTWIILTWLSADTVYQIMSLFNYMQY